MRSLDFMSPHTPHNHRASDILKKYIYPKYIQRPISSDLNISEEQILPVYIVFLNGYLNSLNG